MPNYCDCELRIYGPQKDRDRLEQLVQDPRDSSQVFSFERYLPIPPNKQEDWYNWRIQNWGTKWDAGDPTSRRFLKSLFYRFDTAWMPPKIAIRKLSEKFPTLKIQLRYWECGMCFQGKALYRGGAVLEADEWEYRGKRGG